MKIKQPVATSLPRRTLRSAFLLVLVLEFGAFVSARGQAHLKSGSVQSDYQTTLQAVGGLPPLKWRVIRGELPEGISLDQDTGSLSGRPTRAKAEAYRFTVEVEDSSRPPQRFEQDFEILVQSSTLRGISTSGPRQVRDAVTDKQTKEPRGIGSNSDEVTVNVSTTLDESLKETIANGTVTNATALIKGTVGRTLQLEANDYCVVHVVEWINPLRPPQNKYESANEHWQLFRYVRSGSEREKWEEQTDFDGLRIYGSHRVAVLFVHLGAQPSWDILYKIKSTKKRPAPLQNALDLLAIVSERAAIVEEAVFLWGGELIHVKDLPADITVSGSTFFLNAQSRPTQQRKEFSKTYDNEGRYHWDVTVGLPIKSIDEFKYESKNGVVGARNVSHQNAYAFLNIFPKAFDVKDDTPYPLPHLVFGLPITGKPLDRPFVGAGMGIYKFALKFNVFAGYSFNKVEEPRTIRAGTAATESQLASDLRTRRNPKFIFGLNIPVRLIKDALTKKD